MLKKWREERQVEAQRRAYEEAHARWAPEMAEAERLLGVARTRQPATAAEAEVPVILKKGEGVVGVIEPSALVEPRHLPGQWRGSRQGVSFRIAKGVTYHTGGTRGTFQQGAEVQRVIDPVGRTILTNRRVFFMGGQQTREWAFDKMLGFQHDADTTYINVSNRQKVSGYRYHPANAVPTRFLLDLALAHYQGTVADLISEMETYTRELRRDEPQLALPPPPIE